MSRLFEVQTNAAQLARFENALQKQVKKMAEDAGKLNRAYHNAQWNDTVSERARIELNDYIQNLNHALSDLEGIIRAVGEMRKIAEEYESME